MIGSSFMIFFLMVAALAAEPRSSRGGCQASGCHDEVSKARLLHGPLKAGECAVCHFETSLDRPKNFSDKSTAHKKLVRFQGATVNSTCLTCHDVIKESFEELKAPHRRIGEKACTECHDPHGSSKPKLLHDDVLTSKCFTCHETLKHETAGVNVPHEPFRDEKSCLNCHDFHEVRHPRLLNFKPERMCGKCHSELTGSRPVLHKPVRDGKCVDCHLPHGGKLGGLLKARNSVAFYSNFNISNYQLCFSCHRPELAGRFRNGSENLHYLHLKREKKGYSCATCHEVHASHQQHLIRDSFIFQGVEVPIRFNKTPTGGTCTTSCHGLKRYDRERAVVNAPGR